MSPKGAPFNKSNILEMEIRNMDDSESLLDRKVQEMRENKQLPLDDSAGEKYCLRAVSGFS